MTRNHAPVSIGPASALAAPSAKPARRQRNAQVRARGHPAGSVGSSGSPDASRDGPHRQTGESHHMDNAHRGRRLTRGVWQEGLCEDAIVQSSQAPWGQSDQRWRSRTSRGLWIQTVVPLQPSIAAASQATRPSEQHRHGSRSKELAYGTSTHVEVRAPPAFD